MRAVAAELGTAATSLYRHVADRDALLLAILEQIAEGLPVDVPGRTPKARLRRRWLGAHSYMAGYVWVLHILIRGETVAETAFRFADACLADFMAAGLPPARAMRAFLACWHLTIGELLDRHPLSRRRSPASGNEPSSASTRGNCPPWRASPPRCRRPASGATSSLTCWKRCCPACWHPLVAPGRSLAMSHTGRIRGWWAASSKPPAIRTQPTWPY